MAVHAANRDEVRAAYWAAGRFAAARSGRRPRPLSTSPPRAAARYLKDLYSTDAQASGFLVMACYNWGEDQVLPMVRSMPANPKERNFWKLLAHHREQIPNETYNYVFRLCRRRLLGRIRVCLGLILTIR